jgi:hypothetical protein
MDFDTQVKLAIYRVTAETGRPPSAGELAIRLELPVAELKEAYARLAGRRLLVLQPDGVTVRMAPPFSGVVTQHRVLVDGVNYFANCAWDALGIPAALHRPAQIDSRCEQSLSPLRLQVGLDGPGPSTWLFHCAIPASRWWQDIVFT